MRTINSDDDSYDVIDKIWHKIWRNEAGQFHRDGDLPAVILSDGSVIYYKDGNIHRDNNLPAIIRPDGTVIYYINGKIRRKVNRLELSVKRI